MQEKIEPVQRPYQLAPEQHLQLLPDVRRVERGQTQGQAKKNDYGQGHTGDEFMKFCHIDESSEW